MAKKKATTTKTAETKGSGVTVKKVEPKAEVKKKPSVTDKRKRVTFVSNGENSKLGPKGTTKNIAPETAQRFAENGWGTIK